MNAALLAQLIEAGVPADLVAQVALAFARGEEARESLDNFRAKDRAHTAGYRERRGLSDAGWYSVVGAVIERDGFVCAYCDKDLREKGRYCVDHILPLGRGGTNDLTNLAMACIGCNSSKRDRILGTEWTPPKERADK